MDIDIVSQLKLIDSDFLHLEFKGMLSKALYNTCITYSMYQITYTDLTNQIEKCKKRFRTVVWRIIGRYLATIFS